jgi:hypothetical protein
MPRRSAAAIPSLVHHRRARQAVVFLANPRGNRRALSCGKLGADAAWVRRGCATTRGEVAQGVRR